MDGIRTNRTLDRKNYQKLAGMISLALAMSTYGVAYADNGQNIASEQKDTFKNFENKEDLNYNANKESAFAEFNSSGGLGAINADKAYALGYTGEGVTLGIVDTGVYAQHSEFKDKDVDNFNLPEKWSWGKNDYRHGSHVAGIMVANKDGEGMQGVAYGAQLESIVFDPEKKGDGVQQFNDHINQFGDETRIINQSSSASGGGPYQKYLTNVRESVKKDKVFVFSAGNEGETDISDQRNGVLSNDDITKNNVINVISMNVGTTDKSIISSFSNLAHGAENNTVLAPGYALDGNGYEGITSISTIHTYESIYEAMPGTSQAAPHVSGAMALVEEAIPYLTGKQLVDTILTTANKDFETPKMIVQVKRDTEQKVIGANVVYIDNQVPSIDEVRQDLINYHKNNPNNWFFLHMHNNSTKDDYKDALPNFYDDPDNYEKFADDILSLIDKNKGEVVNLTKEEVYGQGILDVGKAVQGIGAIDVSRLSEIDKSNLYGLEPAYIYQVDTGKPEDNFKQRDYSIWSNDIGEKDGTGGLLKTGDVDLVLLGENTYTGPTVVTGGKLKIIRGVNGDVYASGKELTQAEKDLLNGNTLYAAEINGNAKNVYALRNGNIRISDTVTQKITNLGQNDSTDSANKEFYNKALPKTHPVNIDGGLFAIGKNPIKNEGSIIDVALSESTSTISGPIYQDELSQINLDLSMGAEIAVKDGSGYYDGNTYTGNNKLNNVSLNSFGKIDIGSNDAFDILKIENLSGNDGIFKIKTNLSGAEGAYNDETHSDIVYINNANEAQNHWLEIIDKNGYYVSNNKNNGSVLVANAPNTVNFQGYPTQVGVFSYTPLVDYITDGVTNKNNWYFYGYEGVEKAPINDVVSASGIYTTDDVLNDGIASLKNPTIKVIQGSSPYMLIRKNQTYKTKGIEGSINFIGDGPIKLEVGPIDWYNEAAGIYHGSPKDFTVNQDLYIDVKSSNKDYSHHHPRYGIYSNSSNHNFTFNKNLYVNVENGTVGILNYGNFFAKGNVEVNMLTDGCKTGDSLSGLRQYDPRWECIHNAGDMHIQGNLKVKSSDQLGGAGIYLFNDASLKVDKNLIIDAYDGIYTDGHLSANNLYTNASIKVDKNGTLNISNTINNNLNDKKIDVFNYGKIYADNIYDLAKLVNYAYLSEAEIGVSAGLVEISKDLKADFLENYRIGRININGSGKITSVKNNGTITANELIVDNYTDEYNDGLIYTYTNAEASIGNFKVGNGDFSVHGVVKTTDFEIASGNTDINVYGNFIVNKSEQGIVKIDRNINVFDTLFLDLNNKNSYFNGALKAVNSNCDCELHIKNGAVWYLNDGLSINGGKTYLQDGGTINIPVNGYLSLSKLNGSDGILKFDIEQDTVNSGDIHAGTVKIVRNDTANAKHTVVLNATQADFLLTDGTKIKPFNLIRDETASHGGVYPLDFNIVPFDAGSYNYTPHLSKTTNSDSVNIWQVDDIHVTGTPAPVEPSDDNLITTPVTSSGSYSTSNHLGAGISALNSTISVSKSSTPAMIVNAIDDDDPEKEVGIVGNINFTDKGAVKVEVDNQTNSVNKYTAGIGTLDGATQNIGNTKNFQTEQDFIIDVKSYNPTYGILSTPTYEGTSDPLTNNFDFGGDLSVRAENLSSGESVGIVSTDDFSVAGKTDITVASNAGNATGIDNTGTMHFKNNVKVTGNGTSGNFAAIYSHADASHPSPKITIDNDLTVIQKGENVTSTNGIIENGENSFIDVKGDINIHSDNGNTIIKNDGTLHAKSLHTDSVDNSGNLAVSEDMDGHQLANLGGNVEIGEKGTFDHVSNEGTLIAKSLETDYYEGNDANATASIDSLQVNHLMNFNGSMDVESLSVPSNEANKELAIEFGKALNINKSGKGTVKIDRDIHVGDNQALYLNLNNNQSYFSGEIMETDSSSVDFRLSNGAVWNVQPHEQSLQGKLSVNNGGTIHVPVDAGLNISSMSGTGGVFDFDIVQDAKGSGNINSGKVYVTKNNTENAMHTIKLTPTQADFVLTNDVQVNPFTLVEDASAKNDGYKMSFNINDFDAGVYNYTPTLTNVTNGDNTELWEITDIKTTGSSQPPIDPSPSPANPSSGSTTPDTPSSGSGTAPSDTPSSGSGTAPSGTPSSGSGTAPSDTPSQKPVLSNLTHNVQDASFNNYYRWRNEYNNLNKRLGDLRDSTEDDGIWVRMFRGRQESGNIGMSNQFNAIQVGYDRKLKGKDGNWFVGGAFTSYNGNSHFAHQGNSEDRSLGLALYGSYLGNKGHYVDIVARHGRLTSDLTSYAAGTGAEITGKIHNWGTSFSAEYGRRIGLKHGFFVQPEVELTYGHVGGANYSLSDGSYVSQSGVSSWALRAGVRVGQKVNDNSFYASLNYVKDFGDNSKFSIRDKYGKSYSESTDLGDSWWEVAVGGNFKLNDNSYCYAELEKTFGGNVQTKWQGNVGVRWSF